MVYFLMHEDTKIALFEYENQSIRAVVINKDARNKLPFLEMSSKSDEEKIAQWIMCRGIPVTRQRIQADLRELDAKSTTDYMIDNLGLSLTDHYWILPKDSDYTWKDINLYENDFTSKYSLDLRDDMRSIAGKTNFVPSASLKGDLKKKWLIDNRGVRRLVKGNYNNTCRQSLCEVLATEIHRQQNKFEYVPYELLKISSDGQLITGCSCPNFTDINTEFIPAIDIVNSIIKSNESNYYESYIRYCGEHGLDENYVREFLEYQILTDFIITNTDRHLNNFGVIRNSKTLQLMKPAPIFDSGNSMFYHTNEIKVDYGLLNIKVTSFKKHEVELLKYVTNPGLVDIGKLPSEQKVYDLFMKDPANHHEAVMKLVGAYQKKIEFLNELQSGIKIYSYDYLRKHSIKLGK